MNTTEIDLSNITGTLEARIADECKTVDREAAFDEMLDSCYSFKKVGGIFAGMSPSRVLRECDPIAHIAACRITQEITREGTPTSDICDLIQDDPPQDEIEKMLLEVINY